MVGAGPGKKRFLQDGCPHQNSRVVQKAWKRLGYEVVKIIARSPDLNPIENFFYLVRKKLKADADTKNNMHESYDDFVTRIRQIMLSFPGEVIDNLIGSMPKRLTAVVKNVKKVIEQITDFLFIMLNVLVWQERETH